LRRTISFETRLEDGHLAFEESPDLAFVIVDANDVVSQIREHGSRDQSDVPGSR
jgi:hypothetical protein